MQNLGTLRQLSLGDLADDGKRRERERGERREEKIMPSLMATSLRWPTHSARTKIEGSELIITNSFFREMLVLVRISPFVLRVEGSDLMWF